MSSITTKLNINKRALNTKVEEIIQKTGSNNINTYKQLAVSCFHNHQALHAK